MTNRFLLPLLFVLATASSAVSQECPPAQFPTGTTTRVDLNSDSPYRDFIRGFEDGESAGACTDCWYLIEVIFGFNLSASDDLFVQGRVIPNDSGNPWSGSMSIHSWIRFGEPIVLGFDNPPDTGSWVELNSVRVIATENRSPCGGASASIAPSCDQMMIAGRNVGFVLPVRYSQSSNLVSTQPEPFQALRLSEKAPSADLLNPLCLGAPRDFTNIERIEDPLNPGAVRQLRGIGLIDVVVVSSSEYTIYVYPESSVGPKSGGIYTTTGNETIKYTIKNPDPVTYPGNERVQIIEHPFGGTSVIHDYTWSATNQGWILDRANGLCEETTTTTVDGSGNETLSYLVKNPATSTTLFHAESSFPASNTLVSSVSHNPGPSSLTTSYTYHPPASHGIQIDSITSPDGELVHYVYDSNGRKIEERRRFINADYSYSPGPPAVESGHRTSFNYSPITAAGDDGSERPDEPRNITEWIDGKLIRQSWFIYKPGERQEIIATSDDHAWNDSTNLVTIRKHHTTGTNENRLYSIERPDGTMTLYDYTTVGANEHETETQGEPNGAKNAIVNGIKIVRVRDSETNLLSETTYAIQSGVGTEYKTDEVIYEYDTQGRVTKKTYFDGTYEEMGYTCCHLDWHRDRHGVITNYQYDDMKRKISETRHGISTHFVYDAASNLLEVKRQGTDSSWITLRTATFDLSGTLLTETNALGGTTTYSRWFDSSGKRHEKTVAPDGGEVIHQFYKDGRIERISGDASIPERFEYSLEVISDPFGTHESVKKAHIKQFHTVPLGSTDADTWDRYATYHDFAGRLFRHRYQLTEYQPTIWYPYQPWNRDTIYNSKGQVIEATDERKLTQYRTYNAEGQVETVGYDIDFDNQVTEASLDQIQKTLTDVTTYTDSGTVYEVERTQNIGYPTDNSATTQVLSENLRTTDGTRTWSIVYKSYPSNTVITRTQTVHFANGDRTETITGPQGTQQIREYFGDRLGVSSQVDAQGTVLTSTSYTYDAHGRQQSVTDLRTGTTSFTYNNADLVATVTTPAPNGSQSPQVTQTLYDTSLRPIQIIHPDGSSDFTEYTLTGFVSREYGATITPVEYIYNDRGIRMGINTFTAFDIATGTAGGDLRTTYWSIDIYSDRPLKKHYPAGPTDPPGEDHILHYEYMIGGLLNKEYGLGTTKFYGWNKAGQQILDGPNSYAYDRLGRVKSATYGGMTTSYTYNDAGQVTREAYSGGSLDTFAVEHDYDSTLNRTQTRLLRGVVNKHQIDYSYDTDSGRLITVQSNGRQIDYDYLVASNLIRQLQFHDGQQVDPMTLTRQFDDVFRLTSIQAKAASNTLPLGFTYAYDNANRRTLATATDGTYWEYTYDALGQLTSGNRRFDSSTLVPGQHFTYQYDTIGNRTSTSSPAAAVSTYTSNYRNQLPSRTAPNYADIMGLADPEETVRVGGSNAWRRGAYFHKEHFLASGASTGPLAKYIEVKVTSNPTPQYFYVNRPASPDVRVYNENGDLIQDSYWNYTWDGDGRLLELERRFWFGDAPEKITYGYDHMGRRIYRKIEWNTWDPPEETIFVYDGWNLLGEFSTSGTTQQTYVWGLDLSGTAQGAGGVGGLLMVTDHTASPAEDHYATYDGNGNVIALVDADERTFSALYEYGPFGEPLRSSGPMGQKNPFRFSTKYTDVGSNHIYYGMRYYNPTTGRWISRDPIGEQGGLNLYGFVGNSPNNFIDPIGEQGVLPHPTPENGIDWTLRPSGLQKIDVAVNTVVEIWVPLSAIDALSNGRLYAAVGEVALGKVKILDLVPGLKRVGIDCCRKIKAEITWFTNRRSYRGGSKIETCNPPGSYRPNRELPRDDDGIPIPDSEFPHTQIGYKDGRHGRYTQAREFEGNGKLVKDIDFTDHGRPQTHPNPHQHLYLPNPNGGSPIREKKGRPLEVLR